MDTKKFRFVNKTRDHVLSQAVTLVDSTFEPLTVLRVMVEGLAHNEATGLWLTRVSDLPAVPRLAPFDILYLDKNQQVVEALELLPAVRLPQFRKPSVSALVVPFQTISASKTAAGDELEFCLLEPVATAESDAPEIAAPPPPPAHSQAQPVQAAPVFRRIVIPAAAQPVRPVNAAPLIEASTEETPAAIHSDSGLQPEEEVETPIEAPVPVVEAVPEAGSEVQAEPEQVAFTSDADTSPAEIPAIALSSASTVSSSELELANALNRALASAERGFELSNNRSNLCQDDVEPAEARQEPPAQLGQVEPASRDAAELLRNSRMRKRRPNRQIMPKARKSRAGLRRPETPRPVYTPSSEPEFLEQEAAPAPVPDETLQTPVPSDALVAPSEAAELVMADANSAEMPQADTEHVEDLDSIPVDTATVEPPVVNPVIVAPLSILPEAPLPANPPVQILRDLPARPNSPFEEDLRGNQRPGEPVIGRFLRWLYPAVYQEERRSSVRWPASGLVAYQIRGESLRKLEVRNISSSGIYVLTTERWKPGEMIQLSLQKNGLPEQRVDHRVEVEAGAARFGKDGVGLTFALPKGTDLDLWDRAIHGKAEETGAGYIIKEIRMARALGCVRRICAPALDHVRMMLHKEFSNVRVANAIKIILKAETLLAQEGASEQLIAHPETFVRILELGSWVDTDWIEDLWAGLLATSCTLDGQDCSNLPFVAMLSQFAPIHLRVLGLASAKARHEGIGLGLTTSDYVTAGELAKALDVSNLTKILRTIAELAEYGLLGKAIRSPSSPHDASAKTAVTQLGLEMFARCHGLRETIAPAAWHGISTVIVSPAYTGAAGFMEVRRS